MRKIPLFDDMSAVAKDETFSIVICKACQHWEGPPAENPEWNTNCFRCGTPLPVNPKNEGINA